MASELQIPKEIFDKILYHAKARKPIESCGILAGRAGLVDSFYEMTNTDSSGEHFMLAPTEQFVVAKAIRAAGSEMLAVYHSHPTTPARPSQEDIRLALMPGILHVIVSLANADRPQIGCFAIEDGLVNEVPVVLTTENAEALRLLMRVPNNVRTDVMEYRNRLNRFLDGATLPIAFKAYRVPMGIYEQRTSGDYMVRIRIAAGYVSSDQLRQIGHLGRTFGSGIVHVTTRQDIQIHRVKIEDTASVLEGLLEVHLASRGGGGNTVRNISCCSHSGHCSAERFDVGPYAVALAEYLLQFDSSYNLPRKFKAAFSGCADDCALASVADLGFFAKVKDGSRGFAVYGAGGLGPNPRPAIKLEDFTPADEMFVVAQAVKQLFDKYGDRANRRRARLRYVLARVGEDEFVRLYRQEKRDILEQGLTGSAPEVRTVNRADKTDFVTIHLNLPKGDLSCGDLEIVAQVADDFGYGSVRTTQSQDILIPLADADGIKEASESLARLSVDVLSRPGAKIISCTGAATCKLGLCLSGGLADAIAAEFKAKDLQFPDGDDGILRISGCANSCGHHHIAKLGLEGKAKRIGGRLMPFYEVYAGAEICQDDCRLARPLGAVAAKRIPSLLAEAAAGTARLDAVKLAELVGRYSDLPADIPEDYYYDFGCDEPFSLAGRGPGECGAGVFDVVRFDIDQAKKELASVDTCLEKSECVYRASLAACRALLIVFGLEPKDDRQTFDAFGEHLVADGWVDSSTEGLLDAVEQWSSDRRATLDDMADRVAGLIERVEKLFASLDSNLKFQIPPFDAKVVTETAKETKGSNIDLRGVPCPLNFVKAKLALESLGCGEVLEIMLDEGEAIENVPSSLAEQGQEIVSVNRLDDYFLVKVRRNR